MSVFHEVLLGDGLLEVEIEEAESDLAEDEDQEYGRLTRELTAAWKTPVWVDDLGYEKKGVYRYRAYAGRNRMICTGITPLDALRSASKVVPNAPSPVTPDIVKRKKE